VGLLELILGGLLPYPALILWDLTFPLIFLTSLAEPATEECCFL